MGMIIGKTKILQDKKNPTKPKKDIQPYKGEAVKRKRTKRIYNYVDPPRAMSS